jgi:hypothetical protein
LRRDSVRTLAGVAENLMKKRAYDVVSVGYRPSSYVNHGGPRLVSIVGFAGIFLGVRSLQRPLCLIGADSVGAADI